MMADSQPEPDTNVSQLIALRSDLISTVREIERVLEAHGIDFETAVITRRQRRTLTRTDRTRRLFPR